MNTAFKLHNLLQNETVAKLKRAYSKFFTPGWQKIKPSSNRWGPFVNRSLETYAKDKRGNVTVIFGLSLFVIIMLVGAAVDFKRTELARNEMQDAADTAVLRALRMRNASDDDQLTAANSVFNSNFVTNDVSGVETALSRQTIDNAVEQTFTATGKVTAIFGAFVGMNEYPIQVESRAQSTMVQSEIAFVLDVTGSMAGDNRMVNLKSSVDAALVSLQDDDGNNLSQSKVAFVPFNTQVRLTQGVNYSYIDYGTQELYETCTGLNGHICDIAWDVLDKLCVSAPNMNDCRDKAKGSFRIWTVGSTTYYSVNYKSYQPLNGGYKIYDFAETFREYVTGTQTYTWGPGCDSETGACWQGGSNTYNTTAFEFVNFVRNDHNSATNGDASLIPASFTGINAGQLYFGVWNGNGYGASVESTQTSSSYGNTRIKVLPARSNSKANWTGCIIDRTQPYDVKADTATTVTPASLYPARPCATNALKTMRPLSTDLVAARAFVPTLVSAGNTNITIGVQWGMEALSPSEPLSGGVEFGDPDTKKFMIVVTDGQNTQNRWTTNTNSIDGRTAQACTNAKAKGITVYVVRVMEGNSTLLRNCASDPDKYYDLTTASQLNEALSSIFDSIRRARLTR